jgi:hypothetical protein
MDYSNDRGCEIVFLIVNVLLHLSDNNKKKMIWQMEEKKEQQQKVNLTTMESQEQPDQLIVLSNSVTFALIGASNTMISSGLSAKEVYDVIFGLLGIKRDHPYKMGDLILHFRERNIKIMSVGNVTMPPGDIDFSIRDQFTSGFRQRFLENVLFENDTEKRNFESILKVIDDVATIDHVCVETADSYNGKTFLTIYGSVGDSPESIRVLTLDIPY